MVAATLIETNKIIELSECNLETRCLLTGTLLKWMDIIACLAAEKQANVPCVTASVDDLQITRTVTLGQVITLKAWINRAFNTSMEVEVSVSSEDINDIEKHHICNAFFTFVTQADCDGKKQFVKAVLPITEEEKIQYTLANERKRMRLDYRASLKKMKEDDSYDDQDFSVESKAEGDTSVESTFCECVDIILPQHANHHQTTFGGQLMAWMESTGSISARRLCHNHPRLLAIDEVFFRAPSKVGDRIVIKSQVNNTFDKSMEVGVRVDAYAVGGLTRHIQSAYLTFISPDQNGNPKALPNISATDKESHFRMLRAAARKEMRQERRAILSSNNGNFSVPITNYNQKVLSYKNISSLMELHSSQVFKLKIKIDSILLYQAKINDMLSIKVECDIDNVSPLQVYDILSDHSQRRFWDLSVFDIRIVKELRKNEDYILHYFMHNLSPRDKVKGDDFVVLASTRKDLRDKYMIAYRSVIVDDIPALPEYNRGETRCSGFILEPFHNVASNVKGCKLTYINQLTVHIYEYLKHDLKGATDSFAKRAISLKELIKKTVADNDGKK